MKSWLSAHAVAMRQALRRFSLHPFSSLFEIAVLGFAIALPVGLHLTVENVRTFAARFPAEPEISVFMQLNADRAASAAIEKRLHNLPDVDRVTFISRAEALATLRKSAGLAEVLDALPANPLPDALTVRLKSIDTKRLETVRSEISGWPQVALVQIDSAWARKVEAAVGVGRAAVALLAAVLGIAVIAITFNTVRTQMLERRSEIELSRLIGATNAYIRRPFLYFGALQGFCGAAMALAIVAAGRSVISQALTEFSDAYGAEATFEPLLPVTALSVLAFAVGLGCCAAWLSAGRYLWVSQGD